MSDLIEVLQKAQSRLEKRATLDGKWGYKVSADFVVDSVDKIYGAEP